MTSPFDPTPDDLARIDRARAEAWLTAHGWHQPRPYSRPEWWRHRASKVRTGDGADWPELLYAVAEAHGLTGLALWAVVVAWQAPDVEVEP